MKNSPQKSDRDSSNILSKGAALRTKKLAAMIAALGASIGVNMGEVLAESKELQISETDKAAISRHKLRKPSVKTPKVEQPRVQSRPDVRTPKVEHPNLQSRPSVQADKVSPALRTRPDTKGSKF